MQTYNEVVLTLSIVGLGNVASSDKVGTQLWFKKYYQPALNISTNFSRISRRVLWSLMVINY